MATTTSASERADVASVRARASRVATDVARDELLPGDLHAAWPARTMSALRDAGLMGLLVPTRHGGLGAGFAPLAAACEELGRENPSAGLVFGMHCVGTACIAARATEEQAERYLGPIARGEHVTTLALSEAATGVHFYLPQLSARLDDGHFVLEGEKHFVTNAGHADSYVVSTASLAGSDDPGRFNLLVVDAASPGVSLGREWRGMGMRGNSARSIRFQGARVPRVNLLGEEGAQTWYVFEVVAPYFMTAMAATYLGLALRCVDETREHLRRRSYAPFGRGLADSPVLQQELADMWTLGQQTRLLLHHAAAAADAADPSALLHIMAAKAALDDAVLRISDQAIALGGGAAYQENGALSILHRDARAGKLMAPTANLIRSWMGRTLLDRPLLPTE